MKLNLNGDVLLLTITTNKEYFPHIIINEDKVMRDEFVGDVGDLGKYILLKELQNIAGKEFKIGINWYYNTKPETNIDGKLIQYLSNSNSHQYRNSAPEIFDKLDYLIKTNKRKVREIEKSGVLPLEFHFYSETIYTPTNVNSEREADRKWWFKKSQRCLKNCNIIFLDPDNSIYYSEINKKSKIKVETTKAESVKYAFTDEIKQYYESGKSVIIYSHRNRQPLNQYVKKFITLKKSLDIKKVMPTLKFKKFSIRHYLLLPVDDHKQLFADLYKKLLSQYGFLFEADEALDNLIN